MIKSYREQDRVSITNQIKKFVTEYPGEIVQERRSMTKRRNRIGVLSVPANW
jgi:hypothetical protein